MSYPSQPNQEPLYPQAQPSSPYFQPPGPSSPGYGPAQPQYPGQTHPPGYPPSQQPYSGYGQPDAPNYPPSQQPYQGMPLQQPYAPSIPFLPPPPAKRSNRAIIVVLVIGVLVVVGILHYAVFGPASAVKSYLQAIIQSNGTTAYALVCNSQHNSSLDTLYHRLSQSGSSSSALSIDISAAQYTTSDWGLISETVHLGGSLTVSSNGHSELLYLNEDFPMAASGFGWCIDTANMSTLILQHTHT